MEEKSLRRAENFRFHLLQQFDLFHRLCSLSINFFLQRLEMTRTLIENFIHLAHNSVTLSSGWRWKRKTFAALSNKDVFRHSLLSAADATWKNFHLVGHSMTLWVCLSDRNCRMASSRAMPTIVMKLHNSTLCITLALTVWRGYVAFSDFYYFPSPLFMFLMICRAAVQVRLSRKIFAVIFGGMRQALDWETNTNVSHWMRARKIENDENISPLVCLRLFSMATNCDSCRLSRQWRIFSLPLLDSFFWRDEIASTHMSRATNAE